MCWTALRLPLPGQIRFSNPEREPFKAHSKPTPTLRNIPHLSNSNRNSNSSHQGARISEEPTTTVNINTTIKTTKTTTLFPHRIIPNSPIPSSSLTRTSRDCNHKLKPPLWDFCRTLRIRTIPRLIPNLSRTITITTTPPAICGIPHFTGLTVYLQTPQSTIIRQSPVPKPSSPVRAKTRGNVKLYSAPGLGLVQSAAEVGLLV